MCERLYDVVRVSSFHYDQLSCAPLLAITSQPNSVWSNQGNSSQSSFQFLGAPDPHLVADELQVGRIPQQR